ncbi:amidohydrolase [bacterium]|nr:amidohydrolase [bacterium]
MNKILLKSAVVEVCRGKTTRKDIVIGNGKFLKIADKVSAEDSAGCEIVDCSNFAVLPAFYNGHTHAAMTLLRGYADDMELSRWLNEYIWPFEAKLSDSDIEIASRLAVLEMIKSGTVFFSDMYWHREWTMKVVEEMGIRATIGVTISDMLTPPDELEKNFAFLANHTGESERVRLAVMPHSVYTVSEKVLKRCIEIAKAENYVLHTHLSETRSEVDNCIKQYGCTPVQLFKRLGGLEKNLVAAHCVHFSEEDMKIFADSTSTAVLNPCSNLKLSSGIPQIKKLLDAGIKLALGTDGVSSNNNLDMREEMKFAALLAKVCGSAETLPAHDALDLATSKVAAAYGIDAGTIAEGKLADCLLVNLNDERMVPRHDLISNWVYAADSGCIDSVICNGKFVMKNCHVDGEEDILKEAEACAKRLTC